MNLVGAMIHVRHIVVEHIHLVWGVFKHLGASKAAIALVVMDALGNHEFILYHLFLLMARWLGNDFRSSLQPLLLLK